MNISAIMRDTQKLTFKSKYKADSQSRNKLLKNKTLPNLMNYSANAGSLNNSSTKAITKQFMNPTRKILQMKGQNRTFVEPKTPNERIGKARAFESGSTSRSGGTGEPNYNDLRRKAKERCMLAARTESDSGSVPKSFSKTVANYTSKISNLTKENSSLKSNLKSIESENKALKAQLDSLNKTLTSKTTEIQGLNNALSTKNSEIMHLKQTFAQEKEQDK
jgi:regulator of replication initiation timing